MAECESPQLEIEDLECVTDVRQHLTALTAAIQVCLDALAACVNNVDIPECDICVMIDDLVECHVTARTMVDFLGVTYGDVGAVGVLPHPEQAGGVEFRHGTGVTTGQSVGQGSWGSAAVVFSEAFPTTCHGVFVSPEAAINADPGGCTGGLQLVQLNGIFIKDRTVNGCTVWICGDEFGCDCNVQFQYLAVGD